MREIAPVVDDKVKMLMQKLQTLADKGEGFDIYDEFQNLTMDVIAQMGKFLLCVKGSYHPQMGEILFRLLYLITLMVSCPRKKNYTFPTKCTILYTHCFSRVNVKISLIIRGQ